MNQTNLPTSGTPLSRRQFLTRSLAASTAFAVPNIIPASALGRGGAVAPSERIVMGAIGLGGRGSGDLGWLLGEADVQFVAVCDVQQRNRENAKNAVNGKYNNKDCAAYVDMRELLAERTDIDAMLIATGDRWHTPASILSMQAGKDVYCEKPGALTIAQGQALVAATQRYGRVFQTGAQRASEANFIVAGELARLGQLGKIHTVYAHLGFLPDWPRVNAVLPPQPEPAKEVLDWDLWLGPSPWRPYNGKFLGPWPTPGWYTQYDFAGGIPQWGSHTILQCQLALGLADTSPVTYEFPKDLKGAGMTVHFANGVKLVARCDGWRGSCGVKYEGTDGWVATADGYEKPDVSSPQLLRESKKLLQDYTTRTQRPLNHLRDFLNCVRTRRTPVTSAVVAHRTMTTNLIMDICLDLKRDLKWDPVKEEFVGDAEANRLRTRAMREPWQV
ncbi:MAG: Gfo/Idh/MocA family oxidoreductase [Verrucomicrobiota bacterium]